MKRHCAEAVIAIVLALLSANALQAATLTSSGKINDVRALQNSQPTNTPVGEIAVGDTYTLTATFLLSDAVLTPLFDADPAVNIYYLPGANITFQSGSFSTSFVPLFDFNASVQLWNDRNVVGRVDSQTFSFFDYNVGADSRPFDLGMGLQSISYNVNAFDFTATARTSDLITEIRPFELFSSKGFSLGQLNADTNLFVYVSGTVDRIALLPDAVAVPEPSTWAVLICGFFAIGLGMRRRLAASIAPTAPSSLTGDLGLRSRP